MAGRFDRRPIHVLEGRIATIANRFIFRSRIIVDRVDVARRDGVSRRDP
jgi:hypothetical protein